MKKFLLLIVLLGWGVNVTAVNGKRSEEDLGEASKRQKLADVDTPTKEESLIEIAPGIELELDQREPHSVLSFRKRFERFAERNQPYIALIGYDSEENPTVYHAQSFFQHRGAQKTVPKSHISDKPMGRFELQVLEPSSFFTPTITDDELYKSATELHLNNLKPKLEELKDTVMGEQFREQMLKNEKRNEEARRKCFIEATGALKNVLIVQKSIDQRDFEAALSGWLSHPGVRNYFFKVTKDATPEQRFESAQEEIAKGPQVPTKNYTTFLNNLAGGLSNNMFSKGSIEEVQLLYSALFSDSLATQDAKDEAVKALILIRLAYLLHNYTGPCSYQAQTITSQSLTYAGQLIPTGQPQSRSSRLQQSLYDERGPSRMNRGIHRKSIMGDPAVFFSSWDTALEKYPFFKTALRTFAPLERRMLSQTRGSTSSYTGGPLTLEHLLKDSTLLRKRKR